MTELRKQFKIDHPETIWELDKVYDDSNYIDWLEAKIETLEQSLPVDSVSECFPSNEEVKKHIDSLPYYGSCTTEYNEGFEDGVKWTRGKLTIK